MLLSKNKVKYLSSLKIKKFRDVNKQFIIEGDKIIKDMLKNDQIKIDHLIASDSWLSYNSSLLTENVKEVSPANAIDLSKISSFDAPPPVLAVMNIPVVDMDYNEILNTFAIALENVQDPGNLGTIVRTADWFGIKHVICSPDCVDCYNPKVVQSSMGSILNVKIYYTDMVQFLKNVNRDPLYLILGTFIDGKPVYDMESLNKGVVFFGNESRGLSDELSAYIEKRITIPAGNDADLHVESLNVASSVAIVCSWLIKKNK